MYFWDAVCSLTTAQVVFLFIALLVAFGFEFINGFHDTANAVATVIYTKSMTPGSAVLYSGFLNFLGVLLGGTGLAFSIVNLLPVEKLVDSSPTTALVMVLAMLISAVIWNLGTWYVGLPVSSSHTLIGSIIGVGIAHGLLYEHNLQGVRWDKALDTGLALLFSPLVGFLLAGGLLLLMKQVFLEKRLYEAPVEGDTPPGWIKWAIRLTCGGVSFFHGANDGQKGMGLLMLVLIGFMPKLYSLHPSDKTAIKDIIYASQALAERTPPEEMERLRSVAYEKGRPLDFDIVAANLADKESLADIPEDDRWMLRQAITHLSKNKLATKDEKKIFDSAIQYAPYWVIFMTALCLGLGTMVGYKRIVVTVAEKIGKTNLNYAQGITAQFIAACTICLATFYKLPVSTTHVLSSGVAGTMAANRSGLQLGTIQRIALAWLCTLPACMILAGGLFAIGWVITKI